MLLTKGTLEEAIDNIRGAVMIAFPQGLPEWDLVRQGLEGTEELAGTSVSPHIDYVTGQHGYALLSSVWLIAPPPPSAPQPPPHRPQLFMAHPSKCCLLLSMSSTSRQRCLHQQLLSLLHPYMQLHSGNTADSITVYELVVFFFHVSRAARRHCITFRCRRH